jgi:hypothetical protein
METLLPLRGLALYAQITGDKAVSQAADKAAEVFLCRSLFKRRSTGTPVRAEFLRLHYPLYWHYDILGGLKVMAEAGYVEDARCRDAIDLLLQKRLPDGGWPAESSFYRISEKEVAGTEIVDWGGTGKRRMNEWVTADALAVLAAAGRQTQ